MQRFLAQYWFLAALVGLLAWGTADHARLRVLGEQDWLRDLNMAVVLFVMSIPLAFKALWDTLRRPAAPLLATAVSFVLAPLAAYCIAPFLGKEYGPGLLVAAATPCTMASAAVWTRRAGGNDAVSLVVTALTNFVCFLVTPALLAWTIGHAAQGAKIDAQGLMRDLMLLVVLPIFLGQLIRVLEPVGRWASRNKGLLSLVAQAGILLMVFIAAIKTGHRLGSKSVTDNGLGHFAAMIAAVSGLHLFLFFAGMFLARALRLSREDELAVGFCGSQKTLMVGVRVADACGISILPMVCFHVLQLFIDTILAEHLREPAAATEGVPPVVESPRVKPRKKPKSRGKPNR